MDQLRVVQRSADYLLFFGSLRFGNEEQWYAPETLTKLHEVCDETLKLKNDPDYRRHVVDWSEGAVHHLIQGLATKIRHGKNLTEDDQNLIAKVRECITLLPAPKTLKLKAGLSALQGDNLNLRQRNHIRHLEKEWGSVKARLADTTLLKSNMRLLKTQLSRISEELRILEH
jgi:hypothetical protein